jgi:hypothetical protein
MFVACLWVCNFLYACYMTLSSLAVYVWARRYEGVMGAELELHAFFTPTLAVGECFAAFSGPLNPGTR